MIPVVDPVPPLRWTHAASTASWSENVLTMISPAQSDWARDARFAHLPAQLDTTALVFPVDEDAVIAARVEVVGERTTFDAAVLVVWIDDDHWAKLCFEMSPAAETMVVSVVTNVFSDDANASVVQGDHVHLRIARVGDAFVFQSSADGVDWRFVRLFRLHSDAPAHLGFLSQSPNGGPCTARFSDVSYTRGTLEVLREGLE
ncbi:DUF1349 domain-containing protein [Microbacterium oryzae]|uniref:DUF1349 domain-containing protein n=1 Tax=Microbacterium oryzae TaxID=743009 RepID=UPI0025AFD8C2|nr:DUF1349 domain-containing protein [Microbacterium oryzae]MDN3310187.1 DUF1349 domain-containing protein [Microbacterium oryzae]